MAGAVGAGSGTAAAAAAAAPVAANAGAEADDWASVALHSSSNSSPMIRAVGSMARENNSDTVGPCENDGHALQRGAGVEGVECSGLADACGRGAELFRSR